MDLLHKRTTGFESQILSMIASEYKTAVDTFPAYITWLDSDAKSGQVDTQSNNKLMP